MPSIGWAEMMVLLVLALVVVGPHDLPRLMRVVGGWVRQARAVAFDFQRQFDSMSRDMEIDELRQQVRKLESGEIVKEVSKRHIGYGMEPDVDPDDLSGLPQAAPDNTGEPADAAPEGTPARAEAVAEGEGRA